MNRPEFEIADVIRIFGKAFVEKHQPNAWITRTLNALSVCRTSALGGHIEQCDNCSKERISYNSCRNRHCPKCQTSKQDFWIEDVSYRIPDTQYFHLVFTVPQELNTVFLTNTPVFYRILFQSVRASLQTFGYSYYGVETGALAILHTWGQNLSFHPHIHCLVPAMGISLSGNIKKISKKGKYLYPGKKLSVDFRSQMMKKVKNYLKKQDILSNFQTIIDNAWAKPWVVYSEASFTDAKRVISYLGNYTHRVAISNARIKKVDNQHVHFYYKDYRDKAKKKLACLTGVEFLRRFCMHILPKGFVKIRYFGIMSNRYAKQTVMYRAAKPDRKNETTLQRIKRLRGFDVCKCPFCKKGTMHVIKTLPRIRSPDVFLYSQSKHITTGKSVK
jgi:hypothetical protein